MMSKVPVKSRNAFELSLLTDAISDLITCPKIGFQVTQVSRKEKIKSLAIQQIEIL